MGGADTALPEATVTLGSVDQLHGETAVSSGGIGQMENVPLGTPATVKAPSAAVVAVWMKGVIGSPGLAARTWTITMCLAAGFPAAVRMAPEMRPVGVCAMAVAAQIIAVKVQIRSEPA